MAIRRVEIGFYVAFKAPTTVLMSDPCPLALPEILTVASVSYCHCGKQAILRIM